MSGYTHYAESISATMLKQYVAVGVIVNHQQQVLISKRKKNQHLADRWEFPGGKLEAGESYKLALRRELAEELGITIHKASKLIDTHYQYPDRLLHIQFFKITEFSGNVQSNESQQLRWVNINELNAIQFPPANRAVIDAIVFPSSYMIADEEVIGEELIPVVKFQLQAGIRLIQHRAGRVKKSQYLNHASEIKSLCEQYGAKVIANCSQDWLDDFDHHGIHLTSQRLREMHQESNNLVHPEVFSASCHNEEEIEIANQLSVRCQLIGPVNATKSHPGINALGWKRFGQLCVLSNAPVYALGGMRINDYKTALMHGAQGIAAIRAFTN